jgi:DNA-binding transcriptional ArsR family regulator
MILTELRERPSSVSALVRAVGMKQSAVSHQLRILRNLRLVVGTKTGRYVVYSLYDDHVATLLDEAIAHSEHLTLGLRGPAVSKLVALPASPCRRVRPARHLAVVDFPVVRS